MDSDSTNKVEVIAAAIDGDNLVLETVPHKDRIRWPLNNLPHPLQIGNRMTMELKNRPVDIPNDKSPVPDRENDQEEKKRRLLEDLVN